MPQMTPAQARVIDPILTNIARGYKNAMLVGMKLFPYVPVNARGGQIIEFGKEDFLLYNTARAPGAKTGRVQYGHAGQKFALVQHALEGKVPFELMDDASAVPGINMGQIAVMKTQNIIALDLEYNQAAIATNAAHYAASNKVTLAGTDQWSDYANSNPLDDIETAKEAIRRRAVVRPNVMVIGPEVMAKLKYHPKLLDAALLNGAISAANMQMALNEAQIANILGLKEVIVGDAIFLDNAGIAQDVWGKSAILAYTETGTMVDMGLPSYGYTYRLRDYPIVEQPYMERNEKSWMYPVTDEVDPVIAGADAGYLISAAVA